MCTSSKYLLYYEASHCSITQWWSPILQCTCRSSPLFHTCNAFCCSIWQLQYTIDNYNIHSLPTKSTSNITHHSLKLICLIIKCVLVMVSTIPKQAICYNYCWKSNIRMSSSLHIPFTMQDIEHPEIHAYWGFLGKTVGHTPSLLHEHV